MELRSKLGYKKFGKPCKDEVASELFTLLHHTQCFPALSAEHTHHFHGTTYTQGLHLVQLALTPLEHSTG